MTFFPRDTISCKTAYVKFFFNIKYEMYRMLFFEGGGREIKFLCFALVFLSCLCCERRDETIQNMPSSLLLAMLRSNPKVLFF